LFTKLIPIFLICMSNSMVITKIGECLVCNTLKDNLTEHHVKECNDQIMMVCDDCHKVITWYQEQAIPKFKEQLDKKL